MEKTPQDTNDNAPVLDGNEKNDDNRVISLQVPEGSSIGDVLTFSVNGSELEWTIPAGTSPGDVIQIQLGMNNNDKSKNDVEDEEEITMVDLSSSIQLKLLTIISSTGNDCDGTHAMAWPTGMFLAQWIYSQRSELLRKDGTTWMELGSGLGTVGMSLAVSSASLDKSANILLTDLPAALELLRTNVSNNCHLWKDSAKVQVQTESYIWGNSIGDKEVDWIVASDILYDTDEQQKQYESLISTIRNCCQEQKQSPHILIAARWRKPQLEQLFFQRLCDDLDYNWKLQTSLPWKKEYLCDIPYWETARMRDFLQATTVLSNGQATSLHDLTEEQIHAMSNEEYDILEKLQTQIYIGTRQSSKRYGSSSDNNKRLKSS